MKKYISIFLSVLILACSVPILAFAGTDNFTEANWRLCEEGVESGSLENNDIVFKDFSGNGNTLTIGSGNAKKYLEFSSEKMYDATTGSLCFNNEKQRTLGKGAELITTDGAPINSESFQNGYTIELIYQLPDDFSADDSWMGLLARKGKSQTMTEAKKCSMSLAVSNCKELQFLTANKDDSHEMDSAWSVTMDKGGVWYHIAIVSDGNIISTYINGCEAFRNYESDQMKGMFADAKDGRFTIGGYGNGIFNHYGRGKIQQVRISGKALEKSVWLIQNPEKYVGEYGKNLNFTNLSKSSYNVVFLPDIQNAVEFKPEILYTAANWMNENKALTNTAAIVGLGDNVNTYTDKQQWQNAEKFYSILEQGDFTILQQPGNHDYGDEFYLNSFGADSEFGIRQKGRGVTYAPSGYSSYTLFDGGSYKYMVINISMYHIDEKPEREWLEAALKEHSNYATILTSHSFQDCDAAKPDEVVLNGHGKSVWEIAKKYDQVFMMISGHNHGAGEEVLLNDNGKEVYSILADYQFSYNGGNAFFKFAEFDEAHNEIRISTFSPYAATLNESERTFFDVNYMTGAGNYTTISIDFENRFSGYEQSSNLAEFKSVLDNAKETETEASLSLFPNTKVISKSDAHKVSVNTGISTTQIIIIAVIAVVLILAAVIVITIIVKKKKQKSKAC